MITKKLVSIIMPLYNEEAFVEDAINSVLKQTYNDWELIIIDDGSTDKSLEIVDRFINYMKKQRPAKQLITRYALSENKGIGYARKQGVSMARGEYITFLSADDVWTNIFLERMINNYRGGIIFCDYDTLTITGGRIKRAQALPFSERTTFKIPVFKNKVFQAAREHGMFVNYSGILGNKKCFTGELEFDEDLRFGEDLHHLINASRTVEFTYIPQPLVLYREHKNTTTNKFCNEIHSNNKKIFNKLFGRDII